MKIYHLKSKQLVQASIENCWAFFSDPKNLKLITPAKLGFEVLTQDLGKMYPGQLIEYAVTPLLGIKMHWVTEITHVQKHVRFIDEQRFGPYKLWHHEHTFEQTSQGVLMKDHVAYSIGWGPIGRLANHLIVKKQLQTIFDHRTKKIDEIFPPS